MKEKLKENLLNSYTPYFKFPVSACVLTKDGNTFFGVNVENANGTSICAERNAISNAICNGYKKGDFKTIYVMIDNGKIGTPCFACRQVILEFFDNDDEVICMSNNFTEKKYKVSELCPYPFSEDDLN